MPVRVRPAYKICSQIVQLMRKIAALNTENPIDRCTLCKTMGPVLSTGECVKCRFASELEARS
jgi:hypothetical protein